MAGRGWRLAAGGVCAILLGVVLLQPLRANARGDKLQEAIATFEQRGFVIRREHPRCAEPKLFGLYVRGRREVVVCPRGNQLETLLHQLGRRDRRELQMLYRPDQWPREAEARLMAREPLDRYLQTLDRSCTTAMPLAPKAD